ncbi:N(2)-acetyl-L-2,4-diaminobutanoate deacetylase DoeB2 [Reinekea forsetii]|nr:N(2)-acetyl-L-2,4-diaminobutanoate deacetylase DoeB2 [Reinekea forsetii]
MNNIWRESIDSALGFRHALHRYPELAWQENTTAESIRARLTELGIEWRSCAETGTLATLTSNAPGKHIALRGDIDALPIDEKSGVSWSSKIKGKMHACGHDGHTAALMASAQWLKHNEKALAGPVTFIFQPAEEGGHGAKRMIEEGALDGVDEIYGWHNWPAIPFGDMLCPEGVVMCGNGTFTIQLTGQGGHASQPEQCADPVLAAAAITLNLQQIISRRCAPQAPVVVSVTSIDAPSSATVIPETAELSGSIRVPNDQLKQQVNEWIKQISQDTARSYGVECRVTIHPRYNATINHAEQAQMARDAWAKLFGDYSIARSTATPIMASEDFSYYLEKIPGAFALIGADDGNNNHHPCHSAYYDFNDNLLEKVVRWYAQLCGVKTPECVTTKTGHRLDKGEKA